MHMVVKKATFFFGLGGLYSGVQGDYLSVYRAFPVLAASPPISLQRSLLIVVSNRLPPPAPWPSTAKACGRFPASGSVLFRGGHRGRQTSRRSLEDERGDVRLQGLHVPQGASGWWLMDAALFSCFLIPRRMGKNDAQAHHTSTLVSCVKILLFCSRRYCRGRMDEGQGMVWCTRLGRLAARQIMHNVLKDEP